MLKVTSYRYTPTPTVDHWSFWKSPQQPTQVTSWIVLIDYGQPSEKIEAKIGIGKNEVNTVQDALNKCNNPNSPVIADEVKIHRIPYPMAYKQLEKLNPQELRQLTLQVMHNPRYQVHSQTQLLDEHILKSWRVGNLTLPSLAKVVIAGALLNPIGVASTYWARNLKIHLQTTMRTTSWREAYQTATGGHGIHKLYHGIGPMVVKNAVFKPCFMFPVLIGIDDSKMFESIKRHYPVLGPFARGTAAGIMFTLIGNPMDVINTIAVAEKRSAWFVLRDMFTVTPQVRTMDPRKPIHIILSRAYAGAGLDVLRHTGANIGLFGARAITERVSGDSKFASSPFTNAFIATIIKLLLNNPIDRVRTIRQSQATLVEHLSNTQIFTQMFRQAYLQRGIAGAIEAGWRGWGLRALPTFSAMLCANAILDLKNSCGGQDRINLSTVKTFRPTP